MTRGLKHFSFFFVIPLLACQVEERADPPSVLAGTPIVIRSKYDRLPLLSRYPPSPFLVLSKDLNNKSIVLKLDDLSEVNPESISDLDKYDRSPIAIHLKNDDEYSHWKAIFKGRFVERDEHFGTGPGLLPTGIKTITVKRFTGDVQLIVDNVLVLQQHFNEKPVDPTIGICTVDYVDEQGLILFHYDKANSDGDSDSSQIYIFKLKRAEPRFDTLPKNYSVQGVSNTPKKK